MTGIVSERLAPEARVGPVPPGRGPRQHLAVRTLGFVATVSALVVPALTTPADRRWPVHLGAYSWTLDPHNLAVVAAVLLMPFLRSVSYRKRDALVIALVPLWGALVAGLVVFRLLSLPRRSWPPRFDELDRVGRIPGGRGDYVVRPTYADAEHLRTAWCINPTHQHPYDSWHDSPQAGCRQA